MFGHLIVHKVFISSGLPSSAVRSSQPSNTNGDFVFNPKTQIENFCVLENHFCPVFFPKIFSSLDSRVFFVSGSIPNWRHHYSKPFACVFKLQIHITEIGFTERMFSSHLSDLGTLTNHILLTLDYIFHHICSTYLRT